MNENLDAASRKPPASSIRIKLLAIAGIVTSGIATVRSIKLARIPIPTVENPRPENPLTKPASKYVAKT
jgi:hypothetical protein